MEIDRVRALTSKKIWKKKSVGGNHGGDDAPTMVTMHFASQGVRGKVPLLREFLALNKKSVFP